MLELFDKDFKEVIIKILQSLIKNSPKTKEKIAKSQPKILYINIYIYREREREGERERELYLYIERVISIYIQNQGETTDWKTYNNRNKKLTVWTKQQNGDNRRQNQ